MTKFHPKLILFFAAAIGAFFVGCNEQSVTQKNEVNEVEIDSSKTTIVNVSGKIFSIPSPILTAILIKENGTIYTKDSLHNTNLVDTYIQKHQMALNLGVYGTDMAYASLYDDGQTSLQYFNAIDKLSEKLNIKGALDVDLLKRIGANASNADSLVVLSGAFYRDANYYLKENDRYDIAALVLAGGWIESTFLSVVALQDSSKAARKNLSEQKNTVKTLCEIISEHCEDIVTESDFFTQLKVLNEQYAVVENSYTYEQPETDIETKTTTIKSRSTYTLTDEQLEDISNQISLVRSLIIK
jgi:hypothetical protein